jgi:hypothetical protein
VARDPYPASEKVREVSKKETNAARKRVVTIKKDLKSPPN